MASQVRFSMNMGCDFLGRSSRKRLGLKCGSRADPHFLLLKATANSGVEVVGQTKPLEFSSDNIIADFS
jgi:hypothetical protein